MLKKLLKQLFPPRPPEEIRFILLEEGLEYVEELGHGEFGTTHHVRKNNRDFALKVSKLKYANLRAEAEVMRRVQRVAPTIYLQKQTKEKDYILMDYLGRDNLASRVGKVSPLEALAIGEILGETLAYCHDNDVTHNDVLPRNVVMGMFPRLCDFGISCTKKSWGENSDLYGLAYTLYEAVTGEPLQSRIDLFEEEPIEREYKPIRGRHEIIGPLNEMIRKVYMGDPVDRYDGCREFAAECRQAREAYLERQKERKRRPNMIMRVLQALRDYTIN